MAKDRGWQNGGLKYLLRNTTKANSKTIEVGITKREIHKLSKGKMTVADVYKVNDQGTRKIPKRETLKPSIIYFKPIEYRRNSKRILAALATRQDNSSVHLDNFGRALSKEVKKNISLLGVPPLAPRTIAARVKRGNASVNPLVDTGQLVKAINFEVK